MARSPVLRHLDRAADMKRLGLQPTFSEYSASVTCSIQVT